MITIIAAVAENMAIGNKGQLLYWLPNDLKRFKALTTGHTIIMGRKTYESLPKGALPNRRNVVLSRRKDACFPGCDVYASLSDALASCRRDEDIYIIGGASVYAEALPLADRLCLTHVTAVPDEADAYFPAFGSEWEVESDELHDADEKHLHAYRFTDYLRKPQDCRAEP